MFNFYNLSCDLMEPFRVLVDRAVKTYGFAELASDEKYLLWEILNQTVLINQTHQTVLNAIKIYTRSVFDALNDMDISLLKFYSLI